MGRFYGWTDDHCLRMPATRFFALLRAARRRDALEKAELCDMLAIPGCNGEYYEVVKTRYIRQLDPGPAAVEQRRPVIDAASQQAKNVIFDLFAAKKGLL